LCRDLSRCCRYEWHLTTFEKRRRQSSTNGRDRFDVFTYHHLAAARHYHDLAPRVTPFKTSPPSPLLCGLFHNDLLFLAARSITPLCANTRSTPQNASDSIVITLRSPLGRLGPHRRLSATIQHSHSKAEQLRTGHTSQLETRWFS